MRFLQSKIFTVFIVLVAAFLVWSLVKLWPRKILVQNRLDNLQEKIAETEKSNTSLAKMLDYFKSPAFLERESKLKLNVRRPDENVIFVYPNEKDSLTKPEERNGFSGLEGLTNFEKWIKYLFNDPRGRQTF